MRRSAAPFPLALALAGACVTAACLLGPRAQARPDPGAAPNLANATPTGYERWRGVVNLYNQGPGCTGVLIDPEVVLASGHCTPGFITNPAQVLIAGGADLRDPSGVLPYARVAEVAMAPGFDTGDWMADLAALRLAEPIAGVPYYALHRAPRPAPPAEALVVGYGATGLGLADHGVHREGPVLITDPFLGDPEFNRRMVIFTGPTMVCHGDSGAPVLAPVEGEWQVLALAVRTDSCAPDGLGFAVYLQRYEAWLADTVRGWTGRPLPEHGGERVPTATPSPSPPPTATATASPSPTVTASPSPTATPRPGPVWLPWLAQPRASP